MDGLESLAPPLVAILLAILTRRVVAPLAIGVLVGAMFIAWGDGHFWLGTPLVLYQESIDAVFFQSHVQVLLFSLLLGAMVGVLERGGAMHDLIKIFSERIRSRRGGQTLIAASGLAIFFDDYANTLLVGGTMRTSADRYRISREKLAYLVDSTAAPIAGLSLISTWAAIEISYIADGLRSAGASESTPAFDMFLASIPYRFYPWVAIATVFMIAISGRDFGPMRLAEQQATGEGPRPRPPAEATKSSTGPIGRWLWLAAVVPVGLCLATVACVLGVTGLAELGPQVAGAGWLPWICQVLGSGDSYLALIIGGTVGLAVAIALHRMIAGTRSVDLGFFAAAGAWQMMPAMVILWLAWALSSMTEPDRLDTGGYLSAVLSQIVAPEFLPTAVFLIAGATAFATGTSWGTMGILTPLAISLAIKLDPAGGPDGVIALSTCGSVLAGAIFGDHCSPLSDTTVLSSRACDCDHLAHVKTQLPYAVVVALANVFAGTIPAALGVSPWICLLVQVILMGLVLCVLGKQPVRLNDQRS